MTKIHCSLIIFLVAALSIDGATQKNCSFQWTTDLPSWFPLIWNDSEIVYPFNNGSDTWQIQMRPKTSIQVGCSEASNLLKAFMLPEITLNCNPDGNVKYLLTTTKFVDLGCTRPLKENVVESSTCYNGSTNVNIQFQSMLNTFPLINICHERQIDATQMAHHSIQGDALNPFEVSNRRPSFKEAQFYPTISADTAYTQKSQLAVVSSLVGSSDLGQKYIDVSKSYYFARGHLAPDGDFVHVYEQNATYYFINVVPQWQAINNGNWKALETSVRNYATSKKAILKVWTGGKGVLKLSDINGKPVEIYLAMDDSGKQLLPAPEISWKVIQHTSRNASVAIFMINNPHLTQVPSDLLCKDICSELSWVTWDTSNIQKGYTYCCDMTEAKKVLPYLPNIGWGQVLN